MRTRGFTLIELLVTISIIAFLSSIVLSSVNVARDKARDAVVKSGVLQFKRLMEIEYSETGSYVKFTKGWVGIPSFPCEGHFDPGPRESEAEAICNGIVNAIKVRDASDLYTRANPFAPGFFSLTQQYSIMAQLSTGKFFCAGSSGRVSDLGASGDDWMAPGCYNNP